MKRLITIFFLTGLLSGCLPEYRDGCPDDIRLVFELEDEYETGTYDTRVAADIMLAVFNNRYFVRMIPITYSEIASGREYILKKDDYLVGNVELVAWAASTVEGYDGPDIPTAGSNIDDFALGLRPATRAGDYYYPAECGLYMGKATIDEQIDQPSSHTVGMIHSTCRVEVNVADYTGKLGASGEETAVAVHGSMSRMDLNFKGAGSAAVVRTGLDNDAQDATAFTTGRFGIMPSGAGQTLSVDILNGDEVVATLTLPSSAIPTGATAGSLIIFEYVLGDAEFWVTVNGFKHRVVIIDGV